MYNPIELQEVSADTTIVGDVDAFIDYVESGQALHDWQERRAGALKEIERFFRTNQRVWQYPVDGPRNATAAEGDTPIPV